MKRRRHTPEQIIRKLREADRLLAEGRKVPEVAKQLEIYEATYHRWPHGQALRTEPVDSRSGATDGQSADRSGSLQLPLLFSRPALRAAAFGGRPRPATDHHGKP
jgi:hypothetical protein